MIASPLISGEESKTITKELQEIYDNEASHFPRKRTINFIVTLVLLFITSIIVGKKY
jgi:hypothetical protein